MTIDEPEPTTPLQPSSSILSSRSSSSASSSSISLDKSDIRSNSGICKDLVKGKEDIRANGSFESLFGSTPSQSEVEIAISLLKKFFEQVLSSQGSELKWPVQILEGPVPRILMSYGLGKLYEAFHLLQIDPSVKRLVISLSTDEALWKAIMNNKCVRMLLEPLRPGKAKGGRQISTSEGEDLAASILVWLWNVTKEKVLELAEKFQSLMNEIFQSPQNDTERRNEELEDKVISSLLLSVVIMLIVVVIRIYKNIWILH
ncbi:hypothetical protein UlMin_021235 [Ulmus minor]